MRTNDEPGDRVVSLQNAKLCQLGEVFIIDEVDSADSSLPIKVLSKKSTYGYFWFGRREYINIDTHILTKLEKLVYGF